jgi:biotin-(acetyl-CoA carboxylase) ligase
LARFLDKFEDRIKKAEFENTISKWEKYSVTLNQKVRNVTHKEVAEGFEVDVKKDC